MDPVTALLVSALLVVPASNGNLLAKDVSSWTVDQGWTEVLPGFEVMIQGTYHIVTLLFVTQDPATFRVVGLISFRGTQGYRVTDPMFGEVSAVVVARAYQIRVVATVTLDETGLLIPEDAMLSIRTVGYATTTIDDMTVTVEMNLLAIIKIEGGTVVWARIGVPMGWSFQPMPP